MDNTFNFSIRQALRDAWATFKAHWEFFLGIAVITILLNIAGGKHTPWIVDAIFTIASFIWSIVWLKVSLIAAKNDESKLTFAHLRSLIPSLKEIVWVFLITILVVIAVFIASLTGVITSLLLTLVGASTALGPIPVAVIGVLVALVPVVYVSVRFSFAILAYLDRKDGILKSLKYSRDITTGKFWTVVLVLIVAVVLFICGLILFGVGILVAYPLASILMAKLYLALSDHYQKKETVVVQPAEIPTDLSEVETETQTDTPTQ